MEGGLGGQVKRIHDNYKDASKSVLIILIMDQTKTIMILWTFTWLLHKQTHTQNIISENQQLTISRSD